MKPDWQTSDGSVRLFHGDCLAILPHLSGVDAVVTDPPYGINFGEYESHDDAHDEYQAFLQEAVSKSEALVENGWCVWFQSAKRVKDWASLFNREFRLMAMPKTFIQILPCRGPQWGTDYALFWERGKGHKCNEARDWCLSNTGNTTDNPKGHPCPRPLPQMLHVVGIFVQPNAIALDPFMGSGTTGVACVRLGRRFIGIEKEKKYFDIAVKRITDELNRAPLFDKPPQIQRTFLGETA